MACQECPFWWEKAVSKVSSRVPRGQYREKWSREEWWVKIPLCWDKPWGPHQEQCFWQRKQLKPRGVPVYLGDRIIQASKAGWDSEVWKHLTWRGP